MKPAQTLSSLKGRGVVKEVLSCFDLDVDSAEPTPVSRWSARSAARTNDLDDGAERFSACSVGVEVDEHRRLCGCGATSPQLMRMGWGQGRNLGCRSSLRPRNGGM